VCGDFRALQGKQMSGRFYADLRDFIGEVEALGVLRRIDWGLPVTFFSHLPLSLDARCLSAPAAFCTSTSANQILLFSEIYPAGHPLCSVARWLGFRFRFHAETQWIYGLLDEYGKAYLICANN
jgi:hypothetical protein